MTTAQSETSSLASFREEVRAWLKANCPAEMRTPIQSDQDMCWGGRNPSWQSSAQKSWLDAMAEKGWTTPLWPQEYGGGGLTPEQGRVLSDEMKSIDARSPLFSFGISMLGPALLKFGTQEQKLHYLTQISRGDIRWCQGYSEPGSGSDLASVATRAEDKGDHWIVSGQKVWTSYADKADWIFCLVRTDPAASKQRGISFVLIDMASKGVSTRPIKLISGASPFCETFFDNVVVPKENLIGELHKGWSVAKYLLGHEREMISGMGLNNQPSIGAPFAKTLEQEPVLRAKMAQFDVRAAAFQACAEYFMETFKSGEAHPAQPSMMKYYGTELNKSRHELTMAAEGNAGLHMDPLSNQGETSAATWLRTKGNSIEGGTSEIQLNIIAKHILNLPNS